MNHVFTLVLRLNAAEDKRQKTFKWDFTRCLTKSLMDPSSISLPRKDKPSARSGKARSIEALA